MTSLAQRTEAEAHRRPEQITEAPAGHTTGWWAMILFIATESATFAAFLASYYYLRFSDARTWPPVGDKPTHLVVPSIGTGILVASCVTMFLASRTGHERRTTPPVIALAVTTLAGLAFIALQGLDYTEEWPSSTPSKDAYGSLNYSITALHGFHVAIGIFMLLILLLGFLRRPLEGGRPGSIRVIAMYWYFLAVVAIAVYVTVYIVPRT